MSNASTAALALALGAGAGLAVYHFTRDGMKKADGAQDTIPSDGAVASTPTGATRPGSSTTTATPPRKPGACSIKLDKTSLTVEGERVDIATAVARCKLAGKAELAVAPDAPVAVNRELYGALLAAGVPTLVKTP